MLRKKQFPSSIGICQVINSNNEPFQQPDVEDFFEHSLNGFALCDSKGRFLRINKRLGDWLEIGDDGIDNKRFSDFLRVGSKIYFETHLWPLLLMQGYFDEVAIEISSGTSSKMPVLVNAQQRKNGDGQPVAVWLTVFKATDRHIYEQNLKDAKRSLEISLENAKQVAILRDQFIAILGHDLRNPLGSVVAGASLLLRSTLSDQDLRVVQVIDRSSSRMAELINNIMDFARTRLGDSLVINREPTVMRPILEQVLAELQAMYPTREIISTVDFSEPVFCDGHRIAQLLSNLVSNAITHGDSSAPVMVSAIRNTGVFELTVVNRGQQIPDELLTKLFEPFTRESRRPSQNGLGLGLYIAYQIAKAHKGELVVDSSENETRFTMRIFENGA